MLFFICDVWPLQLLINNPVFYYNICGFLAERGFKYNIPIKLIISSWKNIHWKSKVWVSLSRTVFEIFDFKVCRVWPWPLTIKSHMKSKIFSPFENPYMTSYLTYMTSYLTSIDTFSLSRTVFEIFDFKVYRVRPWPLNFKCHLRSKIFSQFENPYTTKYLNSIDTFSPSRTVFEIFDFKVFRVWPWPLTFKGTWGKIFFHHSEAHTWLPI